MQSGAHIELHRGDHPDPNEKLFNIRGTPQQIEHAQALIRQKCEMVRLFCVLLHVFKSVHK